MYVERNNVARLSNHCCYENATMPFPCTVELQVTHHNLKILRVEQHRFMANLFVDDSKT